MQLTWSHIAGSADSLKEDNNSGTTGGQRYIAREGYVGTRDLDRMHELSGGVRGKGARSFRGKLKVLTKRTYTHIQLQYVMPAKWWQPLCLQLNVETT